jgi:hypothetical protein
MKITLCTFVPQEEYRKKKHTIADIPSQISREHGYVRIGMHNKLIGCPIILA